MGQLIGFYAGDAAAIGADFDAHKFDGLRDGTRARAYADFSLHLSPTDFDILSEVIAEQVGAPQILLLDSLSRHVGGAGDERSADVVDERWVRMVAAVDESTTHTLTAEWIRRVGEDCGQQLTVTGEAIQAVGDLIRLCQLAVQDGLEVVHTWSL